MTRRYILAPEAAGDLVAIWRYLKKESREETADRVESVIRDKIVVLARSPGMGHRRHDLTSAESVSFPCTRISSSIVLKPSPCRSRAFCTATATLSGFLPKGCRGMDVSWV